MTNGRLAELNGGYVLLYESDFGFCIRGRDNVMRPCMEGISDVFLQRDHNGLALEPGQSNAVHEGALVGHVRAREGRMMPEAYDLPKAQAAALAYGVELVWPVLECTRIFKEQEAAVMRRVGEIAPKPEAFPVADAMPEPTPAEGVKRPKGAPVKRKR